MSSSQLETKGFLAALFDFSITSFITLKFLRVIYGLLVVLILLGGLVFFVGALSQGGATAVIGLVGVPLVTLLYLVFARIWVEVVALFFRIGENTSLMVAALPGQQGPEQQGRGQYGPGQQGPGQYGPGQYGPGPFPPGGQGPYSGPGLP